MIAITHFAYAVVRKFSQGLHAKSSFTCTIVSLLMFVVIPCVMQGVVIDRWWVFLIGVVMTYLFYKYAPADTEKSPIIDSDVRQQLRWKSVGVNIFVVCIALATTNPMMRILFIVSMVMQVAMILPIIYKLFGRSYNNYERYETES